MKKRTWEGNGRWRLMTLYFNSDDVLVQYDRDSGCGDDFEDRDDNMLLINLGSCKGKDNIGQVSRKRGVVEISHL